MRAFCCALALAAAVPLAGDAAAQSFPSRPVTLIVPFAPGGPTDTLARVIGEGMRQPLGQPVIIENVAGASGSTGVGRLARAAADGYTIGIGQWDTHVLNGAVFTLPYDLLNDFAPIAQLPSNPQLIVTRNDLPAKNLVELIAWLKANPDKASQGTAGAGSAAHISGAYFQSVTGTRFQFVPYRGAGPAMKDLMGGQIDLMFDQVANSLPQVQAGKIKAFAVTAGSRLSSAPNIPTTDQAGLPGFHISIWRGFWAPKGTPADVVEKLNAAVVAALADGKVRQQLADLGQDIPARDQQSATALGMLHKAEIAKWWPVVRAAKISSQ